MIRFGNDDPFEFVVASGALSYDGGGWWWERPLVWAGVIDPKAFVVVAKTVTNAPRKGNLSMWRPWSCVRTLPNSATTNAVGLTNPGIDYWIENYLPLAQKKGYRIAPSIKPENPDEAKRMASLLEAFQFPFVEVNISCPNVDHIPDDIPQILQIVSAGRSPVVLKLSLDQVNQNFIDAVNAHVSGYHAINTVPWDLVFPGQVSPIEKYEHGLKGGVSGPPIKSFALSAVSKLVGFGVDKPVIGGGGIFSLRDVQDFEDVGASAFSIGTCFLHHPWRPNKIVKEYARSKRVAVPQSH